MEDKYKVHTGGRTWVYFPTMEAANKFCNEVMRQTGDVLSVVEVEEPTAMEIMHCDDCGVELEAGRIGLCDDCSQEKK